MKPLSFEGGFSLFCACATVSLAELASANIVGYQELSVPQGNSMKTASFKAINGDYKVSDIKVSGALGGGSDTAQLMNSDGSWGTMYTYLTEAEMGVPDGWYKDMFGDEPVTDEDALAPGESMIFNAESKMTLTFPACL
jgi:hypothetical protein